MKNPLKIAVVLLLLFSVFGVVGCSNKLSVDKYLEDTKEIIEAYGQTINVQVDSMNDANMLIADGEVEKGLAIIEVTQHLFAEGINKHYQSWNSITPPKEFEEYHSHVSDYFYELLCRRDD